MENLYVMSRPIRLVHRYYLFRVSNSAGLYLPVAILFLQDQGFGLAFIGTVYAVFGFATLLAEIPTGYFGDRLGQRESLALGGGFRVLVLVGYPLVETEVAYLTLHVLWGIGWAFRSGTQDAWLYDMLRTYYDEQSFARIEGRGSMLLLSTSAVGALIGGFLYTVEPAVPFLANAVLAAMGLPLLATFPEVSSPSDDGPYFSIQEAINVLRLQLSRPEIRWLVAYAGLFYGLFVGTRVFEQPALNALGVPVAGFGVLYAGFKIVSAAAAGTVGWVNETLGPRRTFGLLIPFYGLMYASIALVPPLVVPALFLNRSLRTIVRPIRNQYLNDRLEGVGRATVLSGASMVLGLFGGLARLGAGRAAEVFGAIGFLPWMGITVAGGGAILWLTVAPVRTETGLRDAIETSRKPEVDA